MDPKDIFQNKLKKIKKIFSQLVVVSNDINVSKLNFHFKMERNSTGYIIATTGIPLTLDTGQKAFYYKSGVQVTDSTFDSPVCAKGSDTKFDDMQGFETSHKLVPQNMDHNSFDWDVALFRNAMRWNVRKYLYEKSITSTQI